MFIGSMDSVLYKTEEGVELTEISKAVDGNHLIYGGGGVGEGRG